MIMPKCSGGAVAELLVKSDSATTKQQFTDTDAYKDQVEDLNQCIITGGDPLATGVDGLRATDISTAMFESGFQGKVIKIAG